jgi:dTDP-L-rhamnose 4-epimerase
MKRVLVTGGLGFIGMALSRRLLAAGHDVSIIDNLSPQIHGDIPNPEVPSGARITRMDVRHLPDRSDLLEDRDVVIHLAAETGTGQSMYQIGHYVSVNEMGTASLLEAIARCARRPQQVVLASSRSVYGEGAYVSNGAPETLIRPGPRTRAQLDAGQWQPLDALGKPLKAVATPESIGFAPGSVYAATKASQELLLAGAASALGFRCTVFRFQNVYGEGQSLRNPYTGIISIFFNRARQQLDIPLYEDGLESRDFIHVDDIARALQLSLDADLPSGAVMNLGSGKGTSVQELASELLAAAGLSVPVRVTGQFRVGDIRHCFADLAEARRLIGFSPELGLAQGLHRFTAWASQQPVHEDRLAQATEELRRKGLAN